MDSARPYRGHRAAGDAGRLETVILLQETAGEEQETPRGRLEGEPRNPFASNRREPPGSVCSPAPLPACYRPGTPGPHPPGGEKGAPGRAAPGELRPAGPALVRKFHLEAIARHCSRRRSPRLDPRREGRWGRKEAGRGGRRREDRPGGRQAFFSPLGISVVNSNFLSVVNLISVMTGNLH